MVGRGSRGGGQGGGAESWQHSPQWPVEGAPRDLVKHVVGSSKTDRLSLSNQNESVLITARERKVRDLRGDIVKGVCYPAGKMVSTK